METQLLSSAELAAVLGVDRTTVHRWVRTGQLVPFARTRTGNRALFTLEDAAELRRGGRHLPITDDAPAEGEL